MASQPNGRSRAALLLAACALLAAPADRAIAQSAVATSPAEARLRSDVTFLADDLREGRAPGTKGIDAAADHIATVFRELGLKPAPGANGYYQEFTIKGSASLKGEPELAFKGKDRSVVAKAREEFGPLALGETADLDGVPVAFAGYGISVDKDEKYKYDDYSGVDVKGKAVLILRREPQQEDAKSPFDGKQMTEYSDLRLKATNAFQHGARMILLVNDGVTAKDRDVLLRLDYAGGERATGIPFAMITRDLADRLLDAAGAPKLAALEKEIDADLKPRSRVLDGVTLAAKYAIERKLETAKNVVGVLEGSGPLAEETIVVGGHYDHLGNGGLFSGSLAPLSRSIHNGADDNASGTAMVLEMARRMAKRPDPLARRVVFMAFSGEEKGLLGSRFYANNPLYPIKDTVFMVNFDMVGRLNDKDELTLFGVGTTPGAGELVDAIGGSLGFKVKKNTQMNDGMGDSDHSSFYAKDIPVLFAFTGTHTDYHRPSDDSDRINYRGMARVADFGELFLLDLAKRPTRPAFLKAGRSTAAREVQITPRVSISITDPSKDKDPSTPAHAVGPTPKAGHAEPAKAADNPHAGGGDQQEDTARVKISAWFGSIPDYDDSVKGVKLSGVSEGGPAEKAGLKGGDVVVGFGGKPVSTIYDYTNSLARYKPGDVVDVKVIRDGKEQTFKVTLASRPRGN